MAASPASATAPAKKTAKAKSKPAKSTTAATHPPTIDMIVEAIKTLNERSGSSLYAIKKFIEEAHELDMTKYGNNVKRALKHGVETGTLTQTKGTGASGSFKLSVKKGAVEKKKASAAKKTSRAKAEAATTTESKVKPAAAEKKPKKTSTKSKLKTTAKPSKKAAKAE